MFLTEQLLLPVCLQRRAVKVILLRTPQISRQKHTSEQLFNWTTPSGCFCCPGTAFSSCDPFFINNCNIFPKSVAESCIVVSNVWMWNYILNIEILNLDSERLIDFWKCFRFRFRFEHYNQHNLFSSTFLYMLATSI